jgi:hypothetical protein
MHTYIYIHTQQPEQNVKKEAEHVREEPQATLAQLQKEKQEQELSVLAKERKAREELEKMMKLQLEERARMEQEQQRAVKGLQDELQRERLVHEQANGRLQKLEQELQRERDARRASDAKLQEVNQELKRERDTRQKSDKRLQEVDLELQRERTARQASDGKLQQSNRELQRERDARQASDGKLQQVEQELQRERTARVHAEQDETMQQQGLVSGHISTASRSELVAATQQFANRHIIGRGGFGPVYAGTWRGRQSAIKVLNATESQQGVQEFLKEINILGAYQHPNLLPLLGFCISKEDTGPFCALIYPRMVISLEDALRRSSRKQGAAANSSILTASQRVLIALDTARGLAYLHSSANQKPVILHRDIKSSNILLDAQNRACVTDVGLARPLGAEGSHATGRTGTLGYTDKTYILTGEFTPSCDVFSYGVVLVELLTGEAPTDSTKKQPLLHMRIAPRLPREAAAVADPVARWPAPVLQQFASVAKECISAEARKRPTCEAVVGRLSQLVPQENTHQAAAQRNIQQAQESSSALNECVMCMDATRRTRLRPCCHVLFCEACAEQARLASLECPMCRCNVRDYDVGDFNATFVPV